MSTETPLLILASGSPRRADLLTRIGVAFRRAPQDIDESVHDGEAADVYVRRLAREKAAACDLAPGEVVLAADTTVVIDGEILGKPEDEAQALAMLAQLSGRRHQVLTGIAVRDEAGQDNLHVTTEVEFIEVSAALAKRYVATGEPMDKAGGYGLQGAGGMLVRAINGSYSNVVGLPLVETSRLLTQRGIEVLAALPENSEKSGNNNGRGDRHQCGTP